MAEQNDERTKLTGALLGLLTVRMRLHCCSERNGWRSFCTRHLRITVSGSGSGSAAAKRKMLRTTLLRTHLRLFVSAVLDLCQLAPFIAAWTSAA
jgi:hypothetical protein